MHRNDLTCLVSLFRTEIPRAEATISNWIVGHARLFQRLRNRQPVTDVTYERAYQWFSDNWPANLIWPSDIPRPEPSPGSPASKEAA